MQRRIAAPRHRRADVSGARDPTAPLAHGGEGGVPRAGGSGGRSAGRGGECTRTAASRPNASGGATPGTAWAPATSSADEPGRTEAKSTSMSAMPLPIFFFEMKQATRKNKTELRRGLPKSHPYAGIAEGRAGSHQEDDHRARLRTVWQRLQPVDPGEPARQPLGIASTSMQFRAIRACLPAALPRFLRVDCMRQGGGGVTDIPACRVVSRTGCGVGCSLDKPALSARPRAQTSARLSAAARSFVQSR